MEADKIAEAVRSALADARNVREIKMFGGIGFMLNGNMVVAASKRGLLARVGKDGQGSALALAGARAMEMRGRVIEGYVSVDPDALTTASVAQWVWRARGFVDTLPAKATAKPAKSKTRAKKGKSK